MRMGGGLGKAITRLFFFSGTSYNFDIESHTRSIYCFSYHCLVVFRTSIIQYVIRRIRFIVLAPLKSLESELQTIKLAFYWK